MKKVNFYETNNTIILYRLYKGIEKGKINIEDAGFDPVVYNKKQALEMIKEKLNNLLGV